MSKRFVVLQKTEQAVLRQAIERAVHKKFPGVQSFAELDPGQRAELGEAITLNRQTLESYFNGGEIIRCYPKTLGLIVKYIDEPSWKSFLEKALASQGTQEELISSEAGAPGDKQDISLTTEQNKSVNTDVTTQVVTSGGGTFAKNRMVLKVTISVVFVALLLYIVSRQVASTNISARMTTNAITFVLDRPVEIDRIEATEYIRVDSAVLHGVTDLEGKHNKLTARAANGESPVVLSQFVIPAGVQVTIESPVKDQLFIRLTSKNPSVTTGISGSISNFKALMANKAPVIDAGTTASFTNTISFQAVLSLNQTFVIAVINPGGVDIPWMVVREMRFREKDNFHDTGSRSAILGGGIFFPATHDSVPLRMFDDIAIKVTSPLRLRLSPSVQGIKTEFSGEVNNVSVSAETLGQNEVSVMPSIFDVATAALPDLAWQTIGGALTILASIYLAYRKRPDDGGALVIILFVAGVLTSSTSQAQSNPFEKHQANAVAIHTDSKSGSGFICSSNGDSTYVISAYHVVDGDNESIEMEFSDGQSAKGRIVFQDMPSDLVVIGARTVNFKWEAVPIAPDVELGEQVYYIAVLESARPVLPREAIATIDKWDFDTGFQYVYAPGVTNGDSGTALICTRGIVGIVLTQQVKALDIQVAKTKIRAWDKKKWQLKDQP